MGALSLSDWFTAYDGHRRFWLNAAGKATLTAARIPLRGSRVIAVMPRLPGKRKAERVHFGMVEDATLEDKMAAADEWLEVKMRLVGGGGQ